MASDLAFSVVPGGQICTVSRETPFPSGQSLQERTSQHIHSTFHPIPLRLATT